ncbi:stomatin-like protein [Spirochaetia bacterium 38H-sp]|uniref:Stomatin-like protein n=1 Tax=Rarispira pelagica TaxID=3141764 RepID=A0ABU9U9J1_9SPIR
MGTFLSYLISFFILWLVFTIFFRLIRIVPEQEAWIVEQFGKYRKTLGAGLHIIIPIIQKVAYKHTLKEQVIDVSPQSCITKDNVQVTVDGVLYLKVVDPVKASYGINNYIYASIQLSQTTMRSEIGKIELDNTFSERDTINNNIVKAVDVASDPWGVKVTRYEIKDITPPLSVLESMEQQVMAEREKRAQILESEGEREANINTAKGEKQSAINTSEGEKIARINKAEGEAYYIRTVAEATAESLEEVSKAIAEPGGKQAVKLKIAQDFIAKLNTILNSSKTSVMPLDLSQIKAVFDTASNSGLIKGGK